MTSSTMLTRRQFLRVSLTASGVLMVGINVTACARDEMPPVASTGGDPPFAPNAWIRIARDDTVTLLVASSEMGQGVMTALPMLLAEELDADWSKVRAEFAPAHAAYANPMSGRQLTSGSTAVRGYWGPLREAGATVREMLITAAAQTWGVPGTECRTEPGVVVHAASGRRLRYGELVEAAAKIKVPEAAFTKDPAQYRYIGKPLPRLDSVPKVNGSAIFGQDVRLDGMLIAVVARSPVFGGKVKRVGKDAASRMKGVRHIVEVTSGVAVVAEHFWAAQQARDALEIEWDDGPGADLDSAKIRAQFKSAIGSGKTARSEGDADTQLRSGHKVVEADYDAPYLAHACMEPMNCTAHVRKDGCDVWAPTQTQTTSQRYAARTAGLKQDQVNLHTTFLGGGFGRRGEIDFVIEAVEISKAVGAPVKVMWTRADDIQHDYYRPASTHEFAAAIDAKGSIAAWRHRIAGPSILSRFSPDGLKDGLDGAAVEIAANSPYAIPNFKVTYAMVNTAVPVGFWRSVGASQNAYVTECFFDEVARVAKRDPLELRRELLKEQPRLRAVLDLAAEKSKWTSKPPAGRARGVACVHSFAAFVAQVAEVSIVNGRVRVHHVTCAVDCGLVVNPGIVTAQMESAIVFGLTAALHGEITLERGRVKQSNFHDYPLLRIDEMPTIEVHLVRSDDPPGGVGEPGVPPIAPAVANAVFALTGKPVRSLPIRL